MEFEPVPSVLEEDEDDEEPPRILLYHGKARVPALPSRPRLASLAI